MDLLITGLCERAFNGFSFKTKTKKVLRDHPLAYEDPITGQTKHLKNKTIIKEITIKIYLNDCEFVDFKKDLEKSIIKIS